MSKGKKGNESLLLQPGSLMTWNAGPSQSLFMPVAVETPDEHTKQNIIDDCPSSGPFTCHNEPLFKSTVKSDQQISDSGSVSQLRQPLLQSQPPSVVQCTAPNLPPAAPMTTTYLTQTFILDPSSTSSQVQCPPPPQSSFFEGSHFEETQPYQHSPSVVPDVNADTAMFGQSSISFPFPTMPYLKSSSSEEKIAAASPNALEYKPIQPHWCFMKFIVGTAVWHGFSSDDSHRLENAYQNGLKQNFVESVVPVVGGRYDVDINRRLKIPVYWNEKPLIVRRGTWFSKSDNNLKSFPFDEAVSQVLEENYIQCTNEQTWSREVGIGNGEVVKFDGPNTLLHTGYQEDWPSSSESKPSSRTCSRGLPSGVTLMSDESRQIDHLILVVQGIGTYCDLSFRTVYQCVDGFREIANSLIPLHFKFDYDNETVGRTEFLPLAWHESLHTDDVGFDRQMKNISLPSIPKLRYFTNDTLLDILLYSNPMYCQAIIDTVTNGLNRVYKLFLYRNPDFKGYVSVAGHSLGSLILFDILSNQNTLGASKLHNNALQNRKFSNIHVDDTKQNAKQDSEDKASNSMSIETVLQNLGLEEYLETFLKEKIDLESLVFCDESELKELGLPLGPRKKLLAFINRQEKKPRIQFVKPVTVVDESTDPRTPDDSVPYSSPPAYPFNMTNSTLATITFPRLEFHPACFFALGSPISMFLAVRGFSTISSEYCFPTCPSFYHIFHPYDPVAFRIETLIDPNFTEKAVIIPHHKGRKRMHIEIREHVTKMGIELKQKLVDTIKFTWNHLNLFSKERNISSEAMEAEVEKLVEEQLSSQLDNSQVDPLDQTPEVLFIGRLNRRRRIDYVLQEKPIEALNEYIFALTSHATYWNSEDTVLMILKEVYATQGILPKSISREAILTVSPPVYSEPWPRTSECELILDDNNMVSQDAVPENMAKPCGSSNELKISASLLSDMNNLPQEPPLPQE